MMSLATLRAYTPADFETLYQIDQACYPRGIAYSRRTLKWFLSQPGAECIVSECDAGISGFILTELEGTSSHIITIDVVNVYRRSGVGSALLREAERHLAAKGTGEVHLETAHDNQAAIAFWKKHGYRTCGVLQNYYLDRIDAFWMMKNL